MSREVRIVAEQETPTELVFPAYDSVPCCPKCGLRALQMLRYCGPQTTYHVCRSHASQPLTGPLLQVMLAMAPPDPANLAKPPVVDREHMHKQCVCGYEWIEECLDAVLPWSDRPAWLEQGDWNREG